VDGDKQFAVDQLADMTRLWDEWGYTFDNIAGLYYFTPNFDAQEYSMLSFSFPFSHVSRILMPLLDVSKLSMHSKKSLEPAKHLEPLHLSNADSENFKVFLGLP